MLKKGQFSEKTVGKIISSYKNYVTVMIESYNVNLDILCHQIKDDKYVFVENGKEYKIFDQVDVNI